MPLQLGMYFRYYTTLLLAYAGDLNAYMHTMKKMSLPQLPNFSRFMPIRQFAMA